LTAKDSNESRRRLSKQSVSSFVAVHGRKLEVRRIAGTRRGGITLVFLHEGLGSVSMWRDFPEKVAPGHGCSVLVLALRPRRF
jgi:hypothetical protein